MRGKPADKYTIDRSRWLTDEQVTILMTHMLGMAPDIDVYDSNNLVSLNIVPKRDNARKVLLVGSVAENMVADTLQLARQNLQRMAQQQDLNEAEYSFVIPVNLGAPAQFKVHPSTEARGGHWVLATFEPDQARMQMQRRAQNDPIPYKMSFVDPTHNSNFNVNKSRVVRDIYWQVRNGFMDNAGNVIPGLDLGDEFDDFSCGQQENGWACGYLVPENALDLMGSSFVQGQDGKRVRSHPNTDIFTQHAKEILDAKRRLDPDVHQEAGGEVEMAPLGKSKTKPQPSPNQQPQPSHNQQQQRGSGPVPGRVNPRSPATTSATASAPARNPNRRVGGVAAASTGRNGTSTAPSAPPADVREGDAGLQLATIAAELETIKAELEKQQKDLEKAQKDKLTEEEKAAKNLVKLPFDALDKTLNHLGAAIDGMNFSTGTGTLLGIFGAFKEVLLIIPDVAGVAVQTYKTAKEQDHKVAEQNVKILNLSSSLAKLEAKAKDKHDAAEALKARGNTESQGEQGERPPAEVPRSKHHRRNSSGGGQSNEGRPPHGGNQPTTTTHVGKLTIPPPVAIGAPPARSH